MIIWVRKPKRRRITRIEPKAEFEFEKKVGQDRNERALNEIFYPVRSSLPHVLICLP